MWIPLCNEGFIHCSPLYAADDRLFLLINSDHVLHWLFQSPEEELLLWLSLHITHSQASFSSNVGCQLQFLTIFTDVFPIDINVYVTYSLFLLKHKAVTVSSDVIFPLLSWAKLRNNIQHFYTFHGKAWQAAWLDVNCTTVPFNAPVLTHLHLLHISTH